MAGQVQRLIAAAALLVAALAASAQPRARDPATLKTPQTPWYRLSPDEQRILAPVAPEWDRLPGYQQERLKGAVRHYPSWRPIQKERFEQRIRDWASMTPEQRREARETFKGLRQLPPDKQHELRERWLERHPDRAGNGAPGRDGDSPRERSDYREGPGGGYGGPGYSEPRSRDRGSR